MKKIVLNGICLLSAGTAFANNSFYNYTYDDYSKKEYYQPMHDQQNTLTEKNVNFFIDGTAGINFISWEEAKKQGIELPTYNLILGTSAGIQVLPKTQIYNIGFNISYDYMFKSNSDLYYPASAIFKELKIGFSAIGLGLDNYIRLSYKDNKRNDLMLGIGFAQTTAYGSYDSIYGSENEKSNHNMLTFLVGATTQLTDNLNLIIKGKLYIPTESNISVSNLFSLTGGIRLSF